MSCQVMSWDRLNLFEYCMAGGIWIWLPGAFLKKEEIENYCKMRYTASTSPSRS